jgi:hypothetical protein
VRPWYGVPWRAVAASSRAPISVRAWRRYQRSSAGLGVALGHQQLVAAAVDALAPRLGDEPQIFAEERHGAGRPCDLGGGAGERAPAALDPALQLAHGLGRGALGRAAREDHLDLAGAVDADPHAAGARRAADRVVHHPIRWSSHGFDSPRASRALPGVRQRRSPARGVRL